MSDFERVASVDEIADGGRKSIFVDDIPALLVRIGEEYFAIEDVCSHDRQPLTNGPVGADCSITCPRHGAKFNLRTGAAMCMPAVVGIDTFEVQVREGGVFVRARN